MKKSLIVFLITSFSATVHAEKVTYNASTCNLKYGNAEIDFSRGVITNKSGNYDILYCSLPTIEGVNIEQVGINLYLSSIKDRQSSNCYATFYNAEAMSVLSTGSTESASEGYNYLTSKPNHFGSNKARGLLTCNVPGVLEGGQARFTSYTIEYVN